MSNNMVDVTIHIDEETNRDEREGLRDSFLAMNGVMAADYTDAQPHLMIVEYDPDVINSSALLQTVSDRGLHGQMLGL